jgi:hypothetical protein
LRDAELAPPRTTWPVSRRPGVCGTGIALSIGDSTTGEVIGTDFDEHLVASQKLDAKLGQFSSCSAQTLVTGWLLKGDKVKPISLLFLDHTRRFDHAEMKT